MGFEKFTARGKSYRPKAAIWKGGQIGLNQGAVKRFDLQDKSHVIMYYDKEHMVVGLNFTTDGQEEGAARMKVTPTSAVFSAKSFLDYYNIERKETKRYDISKDEGSELYVFDLKKGE